MSERGRLTVCFRKAAPEGPRLASSVGKTSHILGAIRSLQTKEIEQANCAASPAIPTGVMGRTSLEQVRGPGSNPAGVEIFFSARMNQYAERGRKQQVRGKGPLAASETCEMETRL